jgi:hypothetical protein
VLSNTLNVESCPEELWRAITTDLSQLAPAVARCDSLETLAHVRIEHWPAVIGGRPSAPRM